MKTSRGVDLARRLHTMLGGIAFLAIAAGGCGGSAPTGMPTSSTTLVGDDVARTRIPRESCPRSSGGRRAKGVAIALGHGPAYPVLGMQAAPPAALGVAVLEDDIHHGGVDLHKTLWAVSPRARGEIVVRAEALFSHEPTGFFDGPEPRTATALHTGTQTKLRLAPQSGRWAYTASTTLLPGPGCYVFRLSGRQLDQRIVFQAVLRTPAPGAAPNDRDGAR